MMKNSHFEQEILMFSTRYIFKTFHHTMFNVSFASTVDLKAGLKEDQSTTLG